MIRSPDSFRHRNAIHLRHHDIAKAQVVAFFAEVTESLNAIFAERDIVTLAFQIILQYKSQIGIVFN